MRNRLPGYYRPTDDEFGAMWNSGLVVPDTNVLLTLYRLSEGTRAKLLEVFGRLRGQLFLPYQVAWEFQERRVDVIEEQVKAYESVEESIRGFAASVGRGMRQHPRLDKEDLEARITEALEQVSVHLAEIRAGHPDPLEDDDVLGADVVRDALETLFAGRIGEPRDLQALCSDGRKRYERKQPPGWADADKPEPERYGDLAIWLDVLERAEADSKPVILITEERKEDWWWERKGKLVGPRPELVEELRQRSGQRLYLYNVERFMEEASKALSIELSDDERGDVARARAATLRPKSDETVQWYVDSDGRRWKVTESSSQPGVDEIPHRWLCTVEAKGLSARLRIAGEPRYAAGRMGGVFLCVVTGPDGVLFQASRSQPGSAAVLTYPHDFGDQSAVQPGRYTYTWYRYYTPPTTDALPIANGEFELAP